MSIHTWLPAALASASAVADGAAHRPFCPPYTFSDETLDIPIQSTHDTGHCSLEASRKRYGTLLEETAYQSRTMWRAATRYYAPERWEAWGTLYETMSHLECFAAFRSCFPGGLLEEAATVVPVCWSFQEEVKKVFRLDAHMKQAAEQLGMEILTSEDDLRRLNHPCYETEHMTTFKAHDILRRQAIIPASNLFGDHAGGNKGLVPFWVPKWTSPVSHSFDVCNRKDLLKWYDSFEKPTIPSQLPVEPLDWQQWVVNLGAGDGSCVQDVVRQDNLARGLFGMADPANCLLRDGYGGLVFEGDNRHIEDLHGLVGNRTDVEFHFGFVDPGIATQRILDYRARHDHSSPQWLKVDVDNCDCCFVEDVLQAGVRPLMIHVEVHPLVPPPFVYRPTSFDPNIGDSMLSLSVSEGRPGHMLHCSLSAFEELLDGFGYHLVYFHYHDATFARRDVVQAPSWMTEKTLEDVWYGLFYCHPLRAWDPLEVLCRS
ncbi:PDK [Symbiodinium natans]|uniref:PDK protein n=1 Tax=Symbiodinium natans TaxID=878477 RepID=A0A812L2J8_9DINO|nr:PDK [Symbiodinium natans]